MSLRDAEGEIERLRMIEEIAQALITTDGLVECICDAGSKVISARWNALVDATSPERDGESNAEG